MSVGSPVQKGGPFRLVLLVIGTLLLTGSVLGVFVPLLRCPNCNGTGLEQVPEPRKFGQEWQGHWITATCRCCDGRREITAYQRYRYNPFYYIGFSN